MPKTFRILSKDHEEGLEPEGRKWLLTNFTGETKFWPCFNHLYY